MAKRLYTVKAGDTLSKIARDELGEMSRWREVAYINSISEPYTIFPGQNILLPVDDSPLVVTIDKYGQAPPTNGAAVTKKAALEFTPATIAVAIAVAILLFWENK